MNSNSSPETQNEAKIEITQATTAKVVFYGNVDQNVIQTTEDKLKIILLEYLDEIKNKMSWHIPLSIFMTLIIIPLTAEKFKDFLSIPAVAWQAMIYLTIVFALVWLGKSICKSWKSRNATIENVIEKLKQSNKNVSLSK